MIDDKDIITKHCALGMTGSAIAETLGVSKSGVNDFLCALKACKDLKYLSTLETHLLPSFLFNAQRNASLYFAISSLNASRLILGFNETKI